MASDDTSQARSHSTTLNVAASVVVLAAVLERGARPSIRRFLVFAAPWERSYCVRVFKPKKEQLDASKSVSLCSDTTSSRAAGAGPPGSIDLGWTSALSAQGVLTAGGRVLRTTLIVLAVLVAAYVGARWLGAHRWRLETRELRARIEVARQEATARRVDFRELESVPAPVQRYLRTVLEDGQSRVATARIRHRGTFNMSESGNMSEPGNMSESGERWRPFTSDQMVAVERPGFDWNGRISMLPGLTARVHDAYVAGEGLLHASLMGVFSVARLEGTDDLAEGELMRFLAEAVWYPTSLLPGDGMVWESVDESSARATLSDLERSVTLVFGFDPSGRVDTVRAESRGRMVDGKMIPTEWQGRFWNYERRGGMQVPLDGEVSWVLPSGEKPYWRGRITDISYQFAP